MFISLIFPCHNEERAIPQVLPKAIQAKQSLLREEPDLTGFEVLAVDDGSTDKSLELLKEYKDQIKIIALKQRTGYGSAIKEGISQAKGDWIAFCDLDNSCDPRELKLFIKKIRESRQAVPSQRREPDKSAPNNSDGTQPPSTVYTKKKLCCRYKAEVPGRYKFSKSANQSKVLQAVWGHRLNRQSQMPLLRKLGNRLYQAVFFILSFKPAPDPCSGFRLFNKSALNSSIPGFPSDLSFSVAFTAHCLRYKIPFTSVPIFYKSRIGESKLQIFKDGWIFLLTLIKFLYFK